MCKINLPCYNTNGSSAPIDRLISYCVYLSKYNLVSYNDNVFKKPVLIWNFLFKVICDFMTYVDASIYK